jgi:hypothetical protein
MVAETLAAGVGRVVGNVDSSAGESHKVIGYFEYTEYADQRSQTACSIQRIRAKLMEPVRTMKYGKLINVWVTELAPGKWVPVTTAWRVLRRRTVGQPTRDGTPAWDLGEVLTTPHRKNVSC